MQSLTVCVVTQAEMGHFIPALHIAEELAERGHRVTVITLEYNRERCEPMILEAGCKPIFTQDGLSKEELLKAMVEFKLDLAMTKPFDEEVRRILREVKPDVAVIDFFFAGAYLVAHEEQIPFVINEPGLLRPEANFDRYYDSSNLSVKCGIGCWRQSFESWVSLAIMFKLINMSEFSRLREVFKGKVKLINSFWGLDKPMVLPPNWVLTGPLMKDQAGLLDKLRKKDSALLDWLDAAHLAEVPVVYLSLGSVCTWAEWETKALFAGLKELGFKVVWSIKDKALLPFKEDPDFWVSEWIPQVELLAHPALKAGLTHCGFGGVLEFASAGVPIAAFPHFMDQGPNASHVVERGCGLSLIPIHKSLQNIKEVNRYDEPLFGKDKVVQVFKALAEDPKYRANMAGLRRMSRAQGGRVLAAQTVEKVALAGDSHLELAAHDHLKVGCLGHCCLMILLCLVLCLFCYAAVQFAQMKLGD